MNLIWTNVCRDGVSVLDLAWNCERFNMEEQPSSSGVGGDPSGSVAPPGRNGSSRRPHGSPYLLAVSFENGEIFLMRVFDDLIPQVINTGLDALTHGNGIHMDWTNSGQLLAVAGCQLQHHKSSARQIMNSLQFYDESGQLIYRVRIPSLTQPVTSITWGHNDKRVFVATGNQVHVGWITWPNVASLQLLTRYYHT